MTNWALNAIERHRGSSRIALTDGTRSLSYAELWKRSGALAAQLGDSLRRPIAISMQRGVEEVIAILAVLRAGGFYVPIDPKAPPARIRELLDEVQPAAILTTSSAASVLPPAREAITVDLATLAVSTAEAPRVQVQLCDLMYCLFTSGSTGRPKAVEVTHANFETFLCGMRDVLRAPEQPLVCSLTASAFDIFALELFLPLTTGGTIHRVSDQQAISVRALAEIFAAVQPDVVQATPTSWRALLDGGVTFQRPTELLCGGEAMDGTLAKGLVQAAAGGDVINLYGPTEATVWATWHRVRGDEVTVPIGRALPGYEVVVVDAQLRPVPDGSRGEIAILGAGVALGYRGAPELTQARFPELTTAHAAPRRAYLTGDIGEYGPDGLRFLGRADHQVKIDGHRIELGEIEAALAEVAGVKQACVLPRRGENDEPKRLWGFVTASDAGPVPTEPSLRAALSERLPAYMIPSKLQVIDAMPLTVTGKIDRNQLLQRCPTESAGEGELLDPFETFLLLTLQQVLRRQRFEADDDFFDHGGNSIRVVQLISKLDNALRLKVPFKTITDQRSVRKIAASLKADVARYAALIADADKLMARAERISAPGRSAA